MQGKGVLLQDTGDRGPHRPGQIIPHIQLRWGFDSYPVRPARNESVWPQEAGNALIFSPKKEYCILSREHYLKSVSFSFSISASPPPPAPLPSLLGASYLMGGSGERPRLLGWYIQWAVSNWKAAGPFFLLYPFLFLLFWLELPILRAGWGHLELILQRMSRMCTAVCWFQLSLFRLFHLTRDGW